MLTFHKVQDMSKATAVLQQRLIHELSAHKRVLWLLSGGSNIPLSVAVLQSLPIEARAGLAIMLTDERYGVYGHPDSNTKQLNEAGFDTTGATFVPVLTPDNLPLDATCNRYNEVLKTAFAYADVVIGQFGIGPDGHIAGILPHSPAVQTRKLVAGYDAGNFIRITMTPSAFKHVQAAYVFASGNAKHLTLVNLQRKKLPLSTQPAQILRRVKESYVYNDQIEGESI